jgi:hypothetical protein
VRITQKGDPMTQQGYTFEPTDCDLRVISLGAGVQSTTLALLAAHGEIAGPMPDAAIFADTGWEPQAVYDHFEDLARRLHNHFPVYRVTNGNIRDALTTDEPGRYASVPFFLKQQNGGRGMGRRQCTHEYKLKPLDWKYRDLLGKGRKDRIRAGAVEQLQGITTDEAHRMKPSRVRWKVSRYPLIELRMTRTDCKRWLERNGYPVPPKSSCIGCPFHSNETWRWLRDNHPDDWADACAVDRIIRSGGTAKEQGLQGKQYMHRDMVPLEEADIDEDDVDDLFGQECEGMCGV